MARAPGGPEEPDPNAPTARVRQNGAVQTPPGVAVTLPPLSALVLRRMCLPAPPQLLSALRCSRRAPKGRVGLESVATSASRFGGFNGAKGDFKLMP